MYTVSEVAKELRLTDISIYRYISAGKIKSVKIGNKYLIHEEELKRVMREGI